MKMKKLHKTQELFEMLVSDTHEDIISIIDRASKGYRKIKGDKWTLYARADNLRNDFMPMFVSHTDTVSDKKPTNFDITEGNPIDYNQFVVGNWIDEAEQKEVNKIFQELLASNATKVKGDKGTGEKKS